MGLSLLPAPHGSANDSKNSNKNKNKNKNKKKTTTAIFNSRFDSQRLTATASSWWPMPGLSTPPKFSSPTIAAFSDAAPTAQTGPCVACKQ